MSCHQDETLRSFLIWAIDRLLQAGIESPRLDAEVLMVEGLDITRTELMTHSDRILNRSEAELLCSRIERRVLREPVSYITGSREFWSLEFSVNENVLIPRPETEILVEQCLKAFAKTTSPIRILDLGTGSGILSIVLAKEIPESRITAIEKFPKALKIAQKNASRHNVKTQVEFISGDLMTVDWQGLYHLVVSNPPYIETEKLSACMPDVRKYEPVDALNGGVDGLDYYRFIIPTAWNALEENGMLAFEIGHNQASAVTALMEERYQDIQVVQDYSGYDRVVVARKRNKNG